MDEGKINFTGIPDDAMGEIARLAEDKLRDSVTLSLGMQGRATTLTGIFGAAATALIAGAITTSDNGMVAGCIVGAAGLMLAAVSCSWPARSSDFFVTGYKPELLAQTGATKRWVLETLTTDIAERLRRNEDTLARDAQCFNIGLITAAATVPLALLATLII